MILSPNNTPILDIEEFTSQYPKYDYSIYFDTNGKFIVPLDANDSTKGVVVAIIPK